MCTNFRLVRKTYCYSLTVMQCLECIRNKNSQFVCQKTKPWCHTAGCLPPFRSQVSANLSQSFSTASQGRLALEAPSFGSMFTAPHSSGMISSNAVNALFNCTAQRGHHFVRFNWTRCYTIPAFHCWPSFFPDPC